MGSLEGEGELKAARFLNEGGAEPTGGSLARVGPPGTFVPDTPGVKVFGKRYQSTRYFGIRVLLYKVPINCTKPDCTAPGD